MNTQPFSEEEKRFVLAEAIRTSTIPLDRLFHFVNDGRIHIAWDEMLLPRGRNLKQCKDAFEALRPSPPTQMYQFQAHSQSLPALSPIIASAGIKRKSPGHLELFTPASDPKRRQSNDPVPTARDIRPKPPPSNGSPLSMSSFHPSEPKKRGRPSKKDVERKQAEAIARGDIIPPATTTPLLGYASHNNEVGMSNYAPILPTPPSMTPAHVYGPTQSTPMRRGTPESTAELPGKRKQAKAIPKALKPSPKQPGESSFLVNPTISQLVEPQESYATPSTAPPDTGPITGPVPVVSTARSNFPILSPKAPPPLTIQPQPPPHA